MCPPLVWDQNSIRTPVWALCAASRPSPSSTRWSTMKGVWRCDAQHGGAGGRKPRCRHWNVHNGNRRRPTRIDVHCLRCGSRHQHVPNPRDTRGRRSRMRYVPFPHDVAIDILVDDCARRNRNGEQLSNGFERACDMKRTPENLETLSEARSGTSGAISNSNQKQAAHQDQAQPDNVNESTLLIVRVWRRIVTFFRKTSL